MKSIITLLFLFMIVAAYGQRETYFEYKLSSNGKYYIATPLFESNPYKDNKNQCIFQFKTSDGMMYLRKLVNSATSFALKNEVGELKYVNMGNHEYSQSKLTISINDKGQVRYVIFMIAKEDSNLLLDSVLCQIYQKLQTMKLDMNRGVMEVIKEDSTSSEKYFSFTIQLYTRVFKGKKL